MFHLYDIPEKEKKKKIGTETQFRDWGLRQRTEYRGSFWSDGNVLYVDYDGRCIKKFIKTH